MKALKWLAIALAAYVGLVVVFESFIVIMGVREAARGARPDESWIVITTTDASGSRNTVVAGVVSGGQLYVSTNHWPRSWYDRAIKNPNVEVTRKGLRTASRAVPVTGTELVRVAQDYDLPWILRFLTGFPPRHFLRLNPR